MLAIGFGTPMPTVIRGGAFMPNLEELWAYLNDKFREELSQAGQIDPR